MAPRNASPRAERAANDRREQKLAALHVLLTAGIERLTSSDEWIAWLRVASRFHSYSFNNTLLIHSQRPDATQVAGYQVWRQFGRQVNKGEHGIQILAPVIRRYDAGTAEQSEPGADAVQAVTGGEQVTKEAAASLQVVGFRVAHVFDVGQTSGEPLPEPERPQLLVGEAPVRLWDQLAAQVEDRGFELERGPCGGERNGYTDFLAQRVVVRDDVENAQAVKTLAHELGHVLMHGPDQLASRDTRVCRGAAEVEAESVAFRALGSHRWPGRE